MTTNILLMILFLGLSGGFLWTILMAFNVLFERGKKADEAKKQMKYGFFVTAICFFSLVGLSLLGVVYQK